MTEERRPEAELRPVARQSLPAAELVARTKRASRVDPERLRLDLDAELDQSL